MKKIIITLIFLVGCLSAWPQYFGGDQQQIHFGGLEIGSDGYYGTIAEPYQDLFDKNSYFRLNTLYLSAPIWAKPNKNGLDCKALFIYTGLSIQWNNWYFDKDVRISKGSDALIVTNEDKFRSKKSKLVATYIILPAMFEYQFNKNWYLATGVDSKFRIGSRAKYVYYDEADKKKREKNKSDFYLNGFQPDFVAKFGWANLALNFRYGLKPIFQEDKGPDVSMYSLGLMIGI